MNRLLTTTQLAAALELASSTIRHYRAEGRLAPDRSTSIWATTASRCRSPAKAATSPAFSAYRLFIEHRQVDMDVLPTGEFVETAGVATQNAAG